MFLCVLFHSHLYSLQSDYVDMYLLHAPQGGHCAEAYRALLDAKKQGKIRYVKSIHKISVLNVQRETLLVHWVFRILAWHI